MTKKSKLLEKGTRMPDIQETSLDQAVSEYLAAVQPLNSESARSQRFTLLLNRLFGLQPGFIEEYVAGVEKYLKVRQKDALLRGKADELFGNVVIEFERNLAERGKLAEAEGQLRKYVAYLWSQESPAQRTRYLCLAADGVQFRVYTPLAADPTQTSLRPEDVHLEAVDATDVSGLERPHELYFWLDRYLLRREILVPRSESIVKDFGPRSHAFQAVAGDLLAAWQGVREHVEFAVVYATWEKYLRIVYGSAQADDELFMRHTYLATLAKLMAWARLVGSVEAADDGRLAAVLEGEFFRDQRIENFLEEDFFSWPARAAVRPTGIRAARYLLSLLRNYNLRELSEDVLKSLYQELVDPKTRHDLGEYYTPDWLAGRMVRELLADMPAARVLDPSCGSGTFLYQAVREKRRLLGDSAATLEHILDGVTGVDIHPLAVIVAKTNFVLALGDLLKKRTVAVSIPVYLANAIRLPEHRVEFRAVEVGGILRQQVPGYELELDGQTVYLPQTVIEQPGLYDQAIEAACDFARQWSGRRPTDGHFLSYLQAQHPALAADEGAARALFEVAEALRAFIEARRDSIWAFVLKNSFKPLLLRNRFDLIVGNPPWLSYRYVEQPDDQQFLKSQITQNYRLLAGKGELVTQMELGTLFLLRTADLYLKAGGQIAFVLPRSIFTADQHDALRQGTFWRTYLEWTGLWDLEAVEPLFNVPSCVLFGRKLTLDEPTPARTGQIKAAIPGLTFAGRLPRRNAGLAEAESALTVAETGFFLNLRGRRSFWANIGGESQAASPYKRRFYQGATIVPRAFWFVEIRPSPLGFDPNLPPVVTAQRAQEEAKDAYRGLILEGSIEARFLYATLLSTDLLPFGHLPYRPVVLPIEPTTDGYNLITAEEARRRGFLRLAGWLEQVQAEWEKRRGTKAEEMNALEWLNYRRKLTTQNPHTTFRVIYPTSATYVCAYVAQSHSIEFASGGQIVRATGFLVDYVTYSLETDDKGEAYYLAAILNAPVTDKLLKPTQARGLWGPRHICKKVLDLPIPQFDPARAEHQRLAELGRACSERVAAWLAAGGPGKTRGIGRLRGLVREMLREELAEIDEHTTRILNTGVPAGVTKPWGGPA